VQLAPQSKIRFFFQALVFGENGSESPTGQGLENVISAKDESSQKALALTSTPKLGLQCTFDTGPDSTHLSTRACNCG